MTKRLLAMIAEKYPLTPIEGANIEGLKVSGMKFNISAYRAEGIGHVSVMSAKGFFGLMKMDTLIVNPDALDLPLYSYDRILAMGNDTLIVELYDTLSSDGFSMVDVKASYSSLTERDPGKHWYDSIKLKESISKKGKKLDTPTLDRLTAEHFEAYLDAARPTVDFDTKREKAKFYVEGLLEKGGPSTDAFKKAIGEQRTAEIFRNILFGTK